MVLMVEVTAEPIVRLAESAVRVTVPPVTVPPEMEMFENVTDKPLRARTPPSETSPGVMVTVPEATPEMNWPNSESRTEPKSVKELEPLVFVVVEEDLEEEAVAVEVERATFVLFEATLELLLSD